MKQRIFIGSSSEGLEIAEIVQEILDAKFEPTIWDQDVFKPSNYALESLISQLENSDYAIFIFSPDDNLKMRGKEFESVRDNVIFELGLFIGKLGIQRCFIFHPNNIKNFRIPSDLFGVTFINYNGNRSDNNLLAALRPACNKVIRTVEKLKQENKLILNNRKPSSLTMNDIFWIQMKGRDIVDSSSLPFNEPFMIVLDLVNFSGMNNKHGAEICNKVLIKIEEIISQLPIVSIQSSLRRIGDAFIIFFHSANSKTAKLTGEQLISEVENYPWAAITSDLYVHTRTVICKYSGSDSEIIDWLKRSLVQLKVSKKEKMTGLVIAPDSLDSNIDISLTDLDLS